MIYYDIIQTFLHFLDHFRPHPIPQKVNSAGRRAATTGVGGAWTRAGRRYISHGYMVWVWKWYGKLTISWIFCLGYRLEGCFFWFFFGDMENKSFNGYIYIYKHQHVLGPFVAGQSHQKFVEPWQVPSGELTTSNGKSPFLMGKSTISMAIFNCFL